MLEHMTVEGFVALRSNVDFDATLAQLERVLAARAMTVFARFDHAMNARVAKLALRQTTVVFFGDARIGTLLIQSAQTIGIDLPHRFLIWVDDHNQTWLGFNDPAWLAHRHNIAVVPYVAAMASGLTAIANEATHRDFGPQRR